MAIAQFVRRLAVDGDQSVSVAARNRRWTLFDSEFPDISTLRVVDLGGRVDFWRAAPTRPFHVTIVNRFNWELEEPPEPWVSTTAADACSETLVDVLGNRFDLVFSNSVLEHLGGHARRVAFATNVRRLASRSWVQTPYRYFPIEPHWLFPGLQLLPTPVRMRVAPRWPLSHTRKARPEAVEDVLNTELLSASEMRRYFDDSILLRERLAGWTKSLIAARGGESQR